MMMSGYKVYLDVLLLLNFCMDFLLLWSAGRCLRRRVSLPRLLAASALGSVYAAAMVWELPRWLWSAPVAVAVSLLLLALAYPGGSPRERVRLAVAFYLIACAAGGAALAAAGLLQDSLWFGLSSARSRLRWATLLLTVPVTLIAGCRGYTALRRAWSRESFRARLQVSAAGRRAELTALIDTGNDLTEPLTGLPVVVADYRALAALLPERLRQAWTADPEQPERVLQSLSQSADTDGWLRRLRLIPFTSIGRKSGLLLGFRADLVVLEQQGRRVSGQAVVALSRGVIGSGGYQAVVNPALLIRGKEGAA